jgi:hypothetical protein
MNILVKFQPDMPILMVMGGRLTRYGPKIGVPVRSSWKRGKIMTLNFRPPKPWNYHGQSTTKIWWFKALGEVHKPCKYYIWRNAWVKVMSRYGAKLTGKCITDQLQVRFLLLFAIINTTLLYKPSNAWYIFKMFCLYAKYVSRFYGISSSLKRKMGISQLYIHGVIYSW